MTPTTPILGIDPGLRTMGIAVLGPRGRLRHAGVVSTPRNLSLRSRLARVAKELDQALALYRPRLVAMEATWRNQNPSLALLHRVSRLLARHVRRRGIRLVTVPSTRVRRDLFGDGWAGKETCARALAGRYPELRVYFRRGRSFRSDPLSNLFDAVAVALWAEKYHRR